MSKIIEDQDRLKEIVSQLKSRGKRIVFCNGCFNLLHVGHIRYLKEAKRLGDVLIVAVNSDFSVKRLKGEEYPVIPPSERMEILEAIQYVDYITPFLEDRVDSLLWLLKPHVHAKGTDYTADSVPERETVLSYGGEIAIVGDPKNHSATQLSEAIKLKDE